MDNLVQLLSSQQDGSTDESIINYVSSNIDRLISDWNYAAGTSNHGKYGSYTLALATAMEIPEIPNDVSSSIARKILEQDIKVIYRALTMVRQAQTIPSLALLKQFARSTPTELFNQFDFTLRVIPKLLAQQPYRQAFLEFYMELIRNSPPSVRRELFANRKVFSGWFGKLGQEDSDAFVSQTFGLLHTYVLMDVSVFTKSAKMGLFNDWTLKNIQRMLSNPQISSEMIKQISEFIVTLLCDKTYGVRMPGENKLALSFLKIVKPWENVAEMDLVIRLLQDMPDLVVPYFENLSIAYPFNPKASMWWFSYSVLHIRVLKLDPPKFSSVNITPPFANSQPSTEVASKAIIPVTLTKTSLQQALQFKESALVQFQAAQVILFAIRRLRDTIAQIYEPKRWNATLLIDDILTARLPDLHLFTKAVEPPLLQTIYLIILKEVCQLRPLPLTLPVSLEAKEVNGLQLVQAEQLLEVQTITSDQTRWWNPNKGETSLFTQLLQFATFNIQLADKSSLLLQHLVEPSQLFADIPTLAHPIDALLFKLSVHFQKSSDESAKVIWPLLEQTTQRAVRSPYQYIDKVKSYYVSPFLVALIEQYKDHFASKDTETHEVARWVHSYALSLIVLGEDKQIIEKSLEGIQYGASVDGTATGDIAKPKATTKDTEYEEYFDFVTCASDSTVLKRQDIIFKISNRLELAATLHRVSSTQNEALRNHLLASIPEDMLSILPENPAAFSPFIQGSRPLCKAFLTTLESNSSDSMRLALESSDNWDLAIPQLSTEFLVTNKLSADSPLASDILKELTSRGYKLPIELLKDLVDINGVAENIQLWEPCTLDEEVAHSLMTQATSNPKLIAALIRASGVYDKDNQQALHPAVLEAAVKFAHSDISTSQALEVAQKLLETPESEESSISSISIVAQLCRSISTKDTQKLDSIWSSVAGYIETAKTSSNRSVLLPDLVTIAELNPPFLSRWLKIAVHQLTKSYAEHTLTSSILDFLRRFNASASNNGNGNGNGNENENKNANWNGNDKNSVNKDKKPSLFQEIWRLVHPNAINALAEAALRNDHTSETYELISRIALERFAQTSSAADKRFASLSHLTTLYDTTKPQESSVEEVLVIYALYMSNPEANATLEVEQGLLARYNGSLTAKDQVILYLLEQIESHRQRSWIEHVESWEVRPAFAAQQDIDDYGQEPLIALKNSTSVFVTLDEQRIRQSIQEFEVHKLPIEQSSSALSSYDKLCHIINKYELSLPSDASQYYDSWFLLNTVISCDYLLQNMDVFLSSGLLSFTVCALSHEDLRDVSVRLLIHVFNELPSKQFKDQVAVRLLLGKLLMLYDELQASQKPVPSHLPGILGQIILVLGRPTHFLYDKVSKWLLSGPKIRSFDIPLFKTILQSNSDMKLREVLWLVNTLKSGLADKAAVEVLTHSGVIEWCLSQYQLLSVKTKAIKDAVAKLVNRVEELQGGSLIVIKGSGALAVPEFKQRLFISANPKQLANWAR